MQLHQLGAQSFAPITPPCIAGYGSAAGGKERAGPLGPSFDHVSQDDTFGAPSWEKAETKMQLLALKSALGRAKLVPSDLNLLLSGDLLNQCVGSSFAARQAEIPYLGLYGACSTMGEGLALAALLLGAGYGQYAGVCTSSHFCSAERQYRTPLEYGCQRPPTAQWTATAAGAVVLKAGEGGVRITRVTIGTVQDKGIQDSGNMGAAMAPAAYDTLRAHFTDTGRSPDYYDLIVTGDLGALGHQIVTDFFARDGVKMDHYTDCGLLLFHREQQDAHCGASGCGCSAATLCAYLLPGMERGVWRRVLFCPTGALLSPTSTLQGESIPGICHAVALEGVD